MSERCVNCGGYAPPLDEEMGGCTCEGDYRAAFAVPPPEWAVEQYLSMGLHKSRPAVVQAAEKARMEQGEADPDE